jgi:hypothetical protein
MARSIKARHAIRALLLPVLLVALCGALPAQDTKTIMIRVLDGKTGKAIMGTGFMVRIDHQSNSHGDWVKQNEDATAVLTIPADARALSMHVAYDNSLEIYVNCDAEETKDTPGDLWYPVADIMSSGIVAPNGCTKSKVTETLRHLEKRSESDKNKEAERLAPSAKPGEFILFVRERNWKERAKD